MSKYTISQGYAASHEDLAKWGRETGYYNYQPPNPRAPSGSPEEKGWGVPKNYRPPRDAVEHIIAVFKREVAGVPNRDKLRPEFKFSIFSVCMAHFLWLRGQRGARWLLRFYGTEEVPPFWDGYAYFYVDPGTGTPVHITKDGGIELRIFRRCERDLAPAIDSEHSDVIKEMQELLVSVRNPRAVEPIPEPSDGLYHWVSDHLRKWFWETQPDKQWPTPSSSRISGYQWAKQLERKKGVLFYEALDKLELFKQRTYRLKDAKGGILWCGTKDMKLIPLTDLYRHQGTMSEHHLDNAFRCSSCHKMRPCLPTTGDYKMCAWCFGSTIERDLRPTLDWCTMRECRRCTAHVSSHSDLVTLKNKLNREVEFPVPR